MTATQTNRVGVTLLELMVALAIVGMTAGAALLAVRPGPTIGQHSRQSLGDAIAEARRAAVASGAPRTFRLRRLENGDFGPDGADEAAGSVEYVTVLPDGGVIAHASLGIKRLTGRTETERGVEP